VETRTAADAVRRPDRCGDAIFGPRHAASVAVTRARRHEVGEPPRLLLSHDHPTFAAWQDMADTDRTPAIFGFRELVESATSTGLGEKRRVGDAGLEP
jgi:hypothetical protein